MHQSMIQCDFLYPEALNVLKRHFVFDKIFDLIDYDLDMQQLHDELKLLKRDSYEANYRFIFLHYDTEYYIDQKIGRAHV